MSRGKRRRKGKGDGPDPKLVGATWRGLMREDSESLPSLVWRRVFRVHRIDLADPAQADDVQVYRLMRELMEMCGGVMSEADSRDEVINVSSIELEAFIDAEVPRVFPRR